MSVQKNVADVFNTIDVLYILFAIHRPQRTRTHPLVDMDFSFVIPKTTRYRDVAKNLNHFQHPLLKNIRYVGTFEGDVVGPDSRSITIRTVLGDDKRTLVDEDTNNFQSAMEAHLHKIGYKMR